jgi:hypothetical protein
VAVLPVTADCQHEYVRGWNAEGVRHVQVCVSLLCGVCRRRSLTSFRMYYPTLICVGIHVMFCACNVSCVTCAGEGVDKLEELASLLAEEVHVYSGMLTSIHPTG